MATETYSPIQREAEELIAEKGTDLAQAYSYGALINTSYGNTLPILKDAGQYLGAKIVGLTSWDTDRNEVMSQQELEALRIIYGTVDKQLTLGLVRDMRGWRDLDTQTNHVIARLGKNTTHLALSVLNRDRSLMIGY